MPDGSVFYKFPHENVITGRDPLFKDADINNFSLQADSPALNAGISFDFAREDFFGKLFAEKRSIGAIEK